MNGQSLPHLRTTIPGPRSREWVDRLAQRECPAITARRERRAQALGKAEDDPIVWARAVGSNVEDVDGNIFVDLTAGFGVAAAGHRNPGVVAAAGEQANTLIHAMGDAFPDPTRIQLLERLADLTGLHSAILGCSGSDAVDAALKTARLASGRAPVLAFRNSYHGLSWGALPVTDYKSAQFRKPFAEQLRKDVDHLPYGGSLPNDFSTYGAVIVEPIQGRGGMVQPPKDWLPTLMDRAKESGTLVIFDEIYTGFGRTGRWFAFQDPALEGRIPDIVCLGKALGGGFPISACLGSRKVMDAWGASTGEAIHTQTFLGNPLGCAMALASIQAIDAILPTVTPRSEVFKKMLENSGFSVRGQGFMMGIEMDDTLRISRLLLHKGYLVLPAGPSAEVLAVTPPLNITEAQLTSFVATLSAL